MAIEEKDIPTITTLITGALEKFQTGLITVIDQKIGTTVGPLAEQLKQVPGMAARIAKENAEELLKTYKPADDSGKKDKDTIASLKADFEAKINAMAEADKTAKAALAKKELEVDLRGALGDRWIDPNDAFRELQPVVIRGEDGGLYVPTKERIGDSDQFIDRKIPIAKAVDDLAQRKKHYLKSNVQGGTGAGGGGSLKTDFSIRPTYAQLLRDSKLLAEWSQQDPDYVARVSQEAIDTQRADNAKRVAALKTM